MGGRVKRGNLYGMFPTMAPTAPTDANNRGVLIPTTSVDQYGATMANRFGFAPSALPQIFPNLSRFASSDVGFMGWRSDRGRIALNWPLCPVPYCTRFLRLRSRLVSAWPNPVPRLASLQPW
jgi:hypothetical protein